MATISNSFSTSTLSFGLKKKTHKAKKTFSQRRFLARAETEEKQRESVTDVEEKNKQQEVDWKSDEEFKKFMGNPSIEAAIKLEKQRTDTKLRELEKVKSGDSNYSNVIMGLFNRLARDNLAREKELSEQAGETFKALDLNKV